MAKDINLVAISMKYPRRLEGAQGEHVEREGSWRWKPWGHKHGRERKKMIYKREVIENGTSGKLRDCVQRAGVPRSIFGTRVVVCVNKARSGSATSAEATGGCKPVRVIDMDVGGHRRWKLGWIFTEQAFFRANSFDPI